MKFVVVDMQGFCIPEFVPKEMVIYDGYQTAHFLFTSPKPYHILDGDVQRQVKYIQGNIHCINYSDGDTDIDSINTIIRKHIIESGVQRVYVKGVAKEKYLQNTFMECSNHNVEVRNVEYKEDCPKFMDSRPMCMNHQSSFKKLCKCSVNNAHVLYNWLVGLLP